MIRILLALVAVVATVLFAVSHHPHHTGNLLPDITARGVWYSNIAVGSADLITMEDGVFRCDIPHSDGVDWHVMTYYNRLTLVEGQQYRVRFEAKASQNCLISVQARSEWAGERNMGLNQQVPLLPQWVKYDYTFTAGKPDGHKVRAPMLLLGNATGTIWIRNVTMEEI